MQLWTSYPYHARLDLYNIPVRPQISSTCGEQEELESECVTVRRSRASIFTALLSMTVK